MRKSSKIEPEDSVAPFDVAQAFQPAGSEDFPGARPRKSRIPRTSRRECLLYVLLSAVVSGAIAALSAAAPQGGDEVAAFSWDDSSIAIRTEMIVGVPARI